MQVHPVGTDAFLVEVDGVDEVAALYADLRVGLRCRDLVPGARTVLVDGPEDADALRALLAGWAPRAGSATPEGSLVEIPTTYDGPDLDDVARRWGMTRAEAVGTHTGVDLVVAFCGFAPGFGYCTGLPDRLAVPRLERPRPRVPRGSVGLAGEFTGVYPGESPGGWRLLGRTDLSMWDADREPPALLAPGTRVRFTEA